MPTQTTFARETLRGAGLTLRPATLDDVAWVTALQTARDPSEPANEESLRHWWRRGDPERVDHRWIVEEDAVPVGYAYFGHAPWEQAPTRPGRLLAYFPRDAKLPDRLRRALHLLEPYAIADGTKILTVNTREGIDDEYAALVAHGYTEARRSKSWELDLTANRATLEAMTAASRARMRAEGIELLTIDRVDDAAKWMKLHAMVEEAIQDIPTTVPHAPESLQSFMQWTEAPGMHLDRLWVARDGGTIVGMSVLNYPPGVGNVWTEFTGTSRSVRGRGVARALKCETVTQAIALGITHVRTNNDGENKPILHLNEEMGYTRIPGQIQLLKDAPGR